MGLILNIYAIFDSKAAAYLTPFTTASDPLAIRMICSAARDTQHSFHLYPADFTLFGVGHFDVETGQINPMPAHKNLGNIQQLVSFQQASQANDWDWGDPQIDDTPEQVNVREIIKQEKTNA